MQTLLALGIAPVAASNLRFYRNFVIEPALPAGVDEIGLRAEPNLEILNALALDAIVYCPEFGADERLSQITSCVAMPIYDGTAAILDNARVAVLNLGERFERSPQASAYLGQVDQAFLATRLALSRLVGSTAVLFTFLTSTRIRLYGPDSLLGSTSQAIGLHPKAGTPVNRWGFGDIGMERLAAFDAELFIHVGPVPRRLCESPVWRALSFVREGRLTAVPTNWMFGALPSAERFARGLISSVPPRPGCVG